MSPQRRLRMLSLVAKGAKVETVARSFGISCKTLYKWKRRFEDGKESGFVLNCLKDKRRGGVRILKQGKSYYRQTREADVLQVLDFIKSHPELSIAQIELALQGDPNIHIGYHGIYNILKKRHLRTVEDRITYAQTQPETERSQVAAYETPREFTPQIEISPEHLPVIPISDESSSPLGRFFKFVSVLSLFVTSSLFVFFQLLTTIVRSKSIFELVGLLMGQTALVFGFFFFVYSLKYYLTIALVLLFSRKKALDSETFSNVGGSTGLISDVSQVTLNRTPFVSIHLPLYNEKRVVNRLLEAVTSMDYDNYEVIVCDDSTDETTQIVNEWRNHPRLKIIHRQNRAGFKGGALKQALKIMDPKTRSEEHTSELQSHVKI